MAKNINLKLNSLKINTNIDIINESKTPKTNQIVSTIRRSHIVNTTSPKKNSYNSLIRHNPSISQINVNNLGSKFFYSEDDKKEEKSEKPLSGNKGIGVRSASKNGNIFNTSNIYYSNKIHNNHKSLELEGKYEPTTFSPKSTKVNHNSIVKMPTSIYNSGIIKNKFAPLSTRRNNTVVSNHINFHPNNENTPKTDHKENGIGFHKNSNYDSNGPSTSGVEMINVMSLIGSQNTIPLTVKNLNISIPNYESSKYSSKSMTIIKAYAANTHQGLIRTYNEDRVSIILNIIKPSTFTGESWPKCSFFGIYDGHGGASCADFLRDKLHQFIIKDPNFPSNVNEAIRKGFENAEIEFLNNYALKPDGEVNDRSGSCAVIILIVNNICYVANVGDSRAVMSLDSGCNIEALTNDHKPNETNEKKRIVDSGGKVYQTQTPAKNFNINNGNMNSNQILVGPYRVYPGRLSVSRTFGDVEAKLVKYGGLPNVIISVPEIKMLEITPNIDFIVMGCDGIFDQLSNEEVIKSVWMTAASESKSNNIHLQCGNGVDMIIKSSLVRRTLDNVTCVMIAFSNFEKLFKEEVSNTNSNSNSNINTQSNYESNSTYSNLTDQNEKDIKSKGTSAISTGNIIEDKKPLTAKNHGKHESFNGHGINLGTYKNGIIDSQQKKNYIQKKLVSLDMSSNKKSLGNNSSIGGKIYNLYKGNKDKDLYIKKKLDCSEQFDSINNKQNPSTQNNSDYHSSNSKHINLKFKDNNLLIGSIKKISSVKIINEKLNI